LRKARPEISAGRSGSDDQETHHFLLLLQTCG
jgi:hypothetical protein